MSTFLIDMKNAQYLIQFITKSKPYAYRTEIPEFEYLIFKIDEIHQLKTKLEQITGGSYQMCRDEIALLIEYKDSDIDIDISDETDKINNLFEKMRKVL
jgi:hypothetical protein